MWGWKDWRPVNSTYELPLKVGQPGSLSQSVHGLIGLSRQVTHFCSKTHSFARMLNSFLNSWWLHHICDSKLIMTDRQWRHVYVGTSRSVSLQLETLPQTNSAVNFPNAWCIVEFPTNRESFLSHSVSVHENVTASPIQMCCTAQWSSYVRRYLPVKDVSCNDSKKEYRPVDQRLETQH